MRLIVESRLSTFQAVFTSAGLADREDLAAAMKNERRFPDHPFGFTSLPRKSILKNNRAFVLLVPYGIFNI
ncbi:hypothetical protein AC622_16775 [Bacillus sp. FJAT-27916]|nr:hypothetical protein AC622_16775 [Bacillus sp. FJAT-27916]